MDLHGVFILLEETEISKEHQRLLTIWLGVESSWFLHVDNNIFILQRNSLWLNARTGSHSWD